MTLPDGQDGSETSAERPEVTSAPAPENTPSGAEGARIEDAGTTPAVDPEAAEAPMTGKRDQEKVTDAEPKPPSAEAPAAAATGEGARPPSAEGEKPKPAAKAARPAKEPEPKTAPKVAPPAGSVNEILAAAIGDVKIEAYLVPDLKGTSVAVEVGRDDVSAVLTACRDDARLDLKYLRCLSGVDWQEEGLEVVYHLSSFTKPHKLTVKTRITYADASVPSVAAVYPAAEWHEREARDMFGIDFPGHPDLRPLLLPEDMTDHFPLRKDNPLQEIEEWQGENLVEGAGDDE